MSAYPEFKAAMAADQPALALASVTDKNNHIKWKLKPVTHCKRCKRALPPERPVYYLRPHVGDEWKSCCLTCFEAIAQERIGYYRNDFDKAKKSLLSGYGGVPDHQLFSCAECERPVWKRPRSDNPRVFCGPECFGRFYNRMALRKRKYLSSKRFVTCNTCGGVIQNDRRIDAAYCSPACRQKAYRARIKRSCTSTIEGVK